MFIKMTYCTLMTMCHHDCGFWRCWHKVGWGVPQVCLLSYLYVYAFFVCFNLRSNSHAPEDVLPACQTTLKNLQLDYLDLYLVSSYFRLGLLYIVCCYLVTNFKLNQYYDCKSATYVVCFRRQCIYVFKANRSCTTVICTSCEKLLEANTWNCHKLT